jgi:hypothetical protein
VGKMNSITATMEAIDKYSILKERINIADIETGMFLLSVSSEMA